MIIQKKEIIIVRMVPVIQPPTICTAALGSASSTGSSVIINCV